MELATPSRSPQSQLAQLLGREGQTGRVLIVDDDAATREVTAEVLREEGCEVRLAANGQEALVQLADAPVDLILLDLVMPVMDGRAFVRAYQATPGPQAPIVLLTASFHSDAIVAELGVAGRLDKPFDLAALLAVVSRFSACVEGPDPN